MSWTALGRTVSATDGMRLVAGYIAIEGGSVTDPDSKFDEWLKTNYLHVALLDCLKKGVVLPKNCKGIDFLELAEFGFGQLYIAEES